MVLLADVSLTDPAATLSSGTITAKRLLYVSIYMSGRAAGEELVMLFNSDS
jgi:hypothetical protein